MSLSSRWRPHFTTPTHVLHLAPQYGFPLHGILTIDMDLSDSYGFVPPKWKYEDSHTKWFRTSSRSPIGCLDSKVVRTQGCPNPNPAAIATSTYARSYTAHSEGVNLPSPYSTSVDALYCQVPLPLYSSYFGYFVSCSYWTRSSTRMIIMSLSSPRFVHCCLEKHTRTITIRTSFF